MAKTVTSPFAVADYLHTPEDMAAYLEASIEEADGDAAFVAGALGHIARAMGMPQVAREAGLSRESLHDAFFDAGEPSLSIFLRVMGALGLKLRVDAELESDAATGRASPGASGPGANSDSSTT